MLDTELETNAQRFLSWMTEKALPFWTEVGINQTVGAHFERLTAAGTPDLESTVRVRVQARQAFSHAFAASRGWSDSGNRIALMLNAFIDSGARHPTARDGYVHLLDANFKTVDTRQDLYDHAFYLLAYAWLYRISSDRAFLARADQLMDYLDTAFASEYGGWIEGDYPAECRRQNPHMHLFEAFMSLYEASDEPKWLEKASQVFTLFETRFFDPDNFVLLEYFDDSWNPLPGDKGRIIEPGHMMEWVWLLRWYERLTNTDVSSWANLMYSKAYDLGISPSGLMVDEVYLDGSPRGETKRSWPMTELIKANIAQARTGQSVCEKQASQGIDTLFRYFLQVPVEGSWVDQRGKDNEVISHYAPASTLYHLVVACAEVVDYCHFRKATESV